MTSEQGTFSRRLILLGSTGSIGTSTLDVIDHLCSQGLARFEVVGLAAGSNGSLLREQARRFGVAHLALAEAAETLPGGHSGPDSALRLIESIARPGDMVVGAMVGAAGLPATIAAIERGCDIALANKETLVAAGAIVMPLAARRGVRLLPVDSEHSAIFQCLESAGENHNRGSRPDINAAVRRIVITASGGPFRTWEAARIASATVEQALNHPTWLMGRKITIDSATMMNKALEVIEAHWLFGLPAEKIEVIIHPQSLIHSFVEFVDGSIIAQLGPPDMKTPIQLALTWPSRFQGCSKKMDWASLRSMSFEPVDHAKFGAVKLAYEVIRIGGTAGAVLNAANEAAVHAFLDGRISFGAITALAGEALQALARPGEVALEDVLAADREAREWVNSRLGAASSRQCASTTCR